MSEDTEDLAGWQQPSAESSNIAAARAEDGALIVRYRSGHEYSYPGAADMLPDLLGAQSPGKFAVRHLRTRKHARIK